MRLKDSTGRFVRTLYQGIVAATVLVPTLAAVLPVPAGRIGQIVGALVVALAGIAKVIAAAEDHGFIPAVARRPAPLEPVDGTSGELVAPATPEVQLVAPAAATVPALAVSNDTTAADPGEAGDAV